MLESFKNVFSKFSVLSNYALNQTILTGILLAGNEAKTRPVSGITTSVFIFYLPFFFEKNVEKNFCLCCDHVQLYIALYVAFVYSRRRMDIVKDARYWFCPNFVSILLKFNQICPNLINFNNKSLLGNGPHPQLPRYCLFRICIPYLMKCNSNSS